MYTFDYLWDISCAVENVWSIQYFCVSLVFTSISSMNPNSSMNYGSNCHRALKVKRFHYLYQCRDSYYMFYDIIKKFWVCRGVLRQCMNLDSWQPSDRSLGPKSNSIQNYFSDFYLSSVLCVCVSPRFFTPDSLI